jgi:RNA polymerase sigma-70 factor (ECF subfamily)
VNEAEFEILFCETAPRLRRYLARLCVDADDLLQETFFRYLRAGYTVTGEERTRVLFTIATNLARNQWSRKREHTPLEESMHAPQGDPIARIDLIAGLNKLAPRERALMWLTCAEGYGHDEAAHIAGVGRASVRVLLFRARRKLMRFLENEDD